MKVNEALARTARDVGADVMFGLIGDANLFFADQFQRHGGQFVSAGHEAGAVLMAAGHASTGGVVGLCTVTHGAAVGHTVTPLMEASANGTPLVMVAGDTPHDDPDNLQNVPQRDLILPTGAHFTHVATAEQAAPALVAAFARARAESRPVVVNVPADLQWRDVEYAPAALPPASRPELHPDPAAMDRAVGVLASAQRPLMLAGRGAIDIDARARIAALADRVGAPAMTTLKAKDLFRGHEGDFGIFGSLSSDAGTLAISRADCIVAFGTSLHWLTTDHGRLLDGKRVVHCDVDALNLGLGRGVDVGVVGDAGDVAATFLEWLDEAEVPATSFRSTLLADLPEVASPAAAHAADPTLLAPGTVDIRRALTTLDASIAPDRCLVTDGGRFIFETWAHLPVAHPRDFVHTLNIASVGLGMGTAIGATFADRDRPVLLVTGDGGFMLGGITEFNSAVRHGVDLVVAVMNDGAYGAEYVQFEDRDLDPAIATFDWPDFAAVAESLGGRGVTVRTEDDLRALGNHLRTRDRTVPFLVDIHLDPRHVPTRWAH